MALNFPENDPEQIRLKREKQILYSQELQRQIDEKQRRPSTPPDTRPPLTPPPMMPPQQQYQQHINNLPYLQDRPRLPDIKQQPKNDYRLPQPEGYDNRQSQQNSDLQARINRLEDVNNVLREKVSQLESEVKTQKEWRKKTEQLLLYHQSESKELNGKINTQEKLINNKLYDIQLQLNASLQRLDKNDQNLISAIDLMKNEYGNKINSFNESSAILFNQNDKLKTDLLTTSKIAESISNAFMEFKRESSNVITKIVSEHNDLKTVINQTLKSVAQADARSSLITNEGDTSNFQSKIENLERTIMDDRNIRNNNHIKLTEDIDQLHNSLDDNITRIDSELNKYKSSITLSLNEQLDTFKNQLNEEKNSSKQMKDKIGQIIQGIEKDITKKIGDINVYLKAEINDRLNKGSSVNDMIESLKNSLEELAEKHQNLLDYLESELKIQIVNLDNSSKEQKEDIQKLDTSIQDQNVKLSEVTRSNQLLKQTTDKLCTDYSKIRINEALDQLEQSKEFVREQTKKNEILIDKFQEGVDSIDTHIVEDIVSNMINQVSLASLFDTSISNFILRETTRENNFETQILSDIREFRNEVNKRSDVFEENIKNEVKDVHDKSDQLSQEYLQKIPELDTTVLGHTNLLKTIQSNYYQFNSNFNSLIKVLGSHREEINSININTIKDNLFLQTTVGNCETNLHLIQRQLDSYITSNKGLNANQFGDLSKTIHDEVTRLELEIMFLKRQDI